VEISIDINKFQWTLEYQSWQSAENLKKIASAKLSRRQKNK